jgi:hypothetical protein
MLLLSEAEAQKLAKEELLPDPELQLLAEAAPDRLLLLLGLTEAEADNDCALEPL